MIHLIKCFAAAAGALLLAHATAAAQIKLSVPALTFPTILNTSNDIIKAKELDTANGFDMTVISYGTPGAQFAGIAKAEAVAGVLPPYLIAKMRTEGVPIAVLATFAGMEDTQIVTRNPDIKSFNDLKGKSLAATVGFSAYQYLEIYSKKLGLKLNTDIQIVNASSALAQTQLQANRVDAILIWEPGTTRVLKQIPDARVIFTGDQGWKAVTGEAGWDVVVWVNTDWAKANPGALPRLVKMYQDYANVMMRTPDDADGIISSEKYTSKGIPAGTISTAINSKRLSIVVKPTWEADANRQLWQMFDLGLKEGFMTTAADRGSVISEAPKP
jgi:ABC-type nitrate/sulfonate/bicarbonate transport system substrate-binding protein